MLVWLLAAPPEGPAEIAPVAASAPEWPEGPLRQVRGSLGAPLHVALRALDDRRRPLDYRAEGLPEGSKLSVHPGPDGSAAIDWIPGPEAAGTYEIKVVAKTSAGEAEQVVRISVEEVWVGYLMPGLRYSTFVPNDLDAWGSFHGVSVEFVAISWIHRNDAPGPSHGRIHLDLDILASTRSEVSTSFDLSGGVDLTFEGNPARRYLLPFYGLEVGALFNRQQTTTIGHLTPMAGVHLWAQPNLFVSLSGGYLLPLRGPDFDSLRGVRAGLGIDGSLW